MKTSKEMKVEEEVVVILWISSILHSKISRVHNVTRLSKVPEHEILMLKTFISK